MKPNDPMTPDGKNLLLAIMLSLAVLFAFYHFIDQPALKKKQEEQERQADTYQAEHPVAARAIPEPAPREEVVHESKRIRINTPSLHGSINLTGGRFDDATLAKYFETIEKKDEVLLLSPVGSAAPYYVDYGFLPDDKNAVKVPGANTVWSSQQTELTPTTPVTLHWDNGAGLTFERVISIDDRYMISVIQRVINKSGKDAIVYPFARVTRPHITPYPGHWRGERSMRILHEGPLGFLQGRLSEWNYKKLSDSDEETKDQQIEKADSKGGWLGMTDKYWLVAMIPDQAENIAARFIRTGQLQQTGSWPVHKVIGDDRDFQVDYRGAPLTTAAGQTSDYKSNFFIGAKEVNLLDAYEKSYNVPRFDLAVDFGWFYFLTKPLFYALDWIGKHVGNFGIAIILLTLVVRSAVFPITSRSASSMAKMKKFQPQLKELQTKHKGDQQKLQTEMMALYKREKFNPAGGCLPLLIQIPIFFSLYKVLFVTIEMRHAPFYGWIHDLSAPDPTSVFNLFGLLPFHAPIALGLLPILMGLTMYIQMKLNPPPTDPTQRAMMSYMPFFVMFMMASFPAGLILYWTFSNIFGIVQQYFIQRKIRAADNSA